MYLSVDKIFQSLWFLSGDRGLLLTFGKYCSSNICSIFSFLCIVVSTIVYLYVKLLDRPHLEERCLHLFLLTKLDHKTIHSSTELQILYLWPHSFSSCIDFRGLVENTTFICGFDTILLISLVKYIFPGALQLNGLMGPMKTMKTFN